jgi:hypothetical protein
MRLLAAVLFLLVSLFSDADARKGTLILKTGDRLRGEIQYTGNGGYSITSLHISMQFERDEVQKIIWAPQSSKPLPKISFKNTKPGPTITEDVVYPLYANATPYDDIIRQAAQKHRLDPALIKAVMKAESNFNPVDTSAKGACGLMQLMPATANILGVKSIYSPHENVQAGAHYLRDMLSLFNGDIELALAAYNAGPTTVQKYHDIPPYLETQNYVRRVVRYYNMYQGKTASSGRKSRVLSYTDKKGCLYLYNTR